MQAVILSLGFVTWQYMHVGFIIYYMFIQRALKPVAELSTTVVDISSTTVVDISSCTLVDNWCVLARILWINIYYTMSASIRRAKNDIYPGWIKKGTVASNSAALTSPCCMSSNAYLANIISLMRAENPSPSHLNLASPATRTIINTNK